MLERVPAEGRSLRVAQAGLNVRECEVRNQESAMEFLKGV